MSDNYYKTYADNTWVKAWPLDEKGSRKEEAKVEKTSDGKSVLQISPAYATLWYEIE